MLTMKCPACGDSLDAPAAVCPKCEFTLRRLDSKFGTIPLHNRYLTDCARSLSLQEVARLRDLLRHFEIKFPQLLFSVFVTDLPSGSSIKEYAFWLANRANFGSVDSTGAENFDLLLVVEPAHYAAALTVGYGLEKFVTEDDLRDALDAVEPALHDDQLERAIRICIEEMTHRLCDVSKAATAANSIAPLRTQDW
jgi:uncharacterized membrane protein YgcG